MLGRFDNRAQIAAGEQGGGLQTDGVVSLTVRPLQDPVVFQDALYVYFEMRREGEDQPFRQKVYRLKKSGRRIRLELFSIDARILTAVALEPQMLGNLAPVDLTKEEGCDLLLDRREGGYSGSTGIGKCRPKWEGSAYVVSALRIEGGLVVALDQGYDAEGKLAFGPRGGHGYEFRRVEP